MHFEVNSDRMPKHDATGASHTAVVVGADGGDQGSPFLRIGECRICQEEDSLTNLESPCACSGSVKYAHRKCVQHWCNEKGDTKCEICHQAYRHGYTAPSRPSLDETSIDIGELWQISETSIDLNDPRLVTITEAERQLLEADYDEYNAANSHSTTFYHSAALALMAFLLLRHAISVADTGNGDEDASNFFSLFWFRVFRFLLPCYIMIWAFSILQRLRQRQDVAAMAAAQFTIVVQSAQHRGLMVAMASSPTMNSLTTAARAFE